MGNLINFDDARKKKLESEKAKLSGDLQLYLKYRLDTTNQLETVFQFLTEFENVELKYSKNHKMTREKLDFYVTTKMTFLSVIEFVRATDEKVRKSHPNVIFPDLDYYTF